MVECKDYDYILDICGCDEKRADEVCERYAGVSIRFPKKRPIRNKIAELLRENMSIRDISEQLNVSRWLVRKIEQGELTTTRQPIKK
ncbi:hypothetical protein FACS189487_10550 [Campylobacterota bacterium]|nr:hypothetical protein FACS189487_10550 [Campylobacterota bacterium]